MTVGDANLKFELEFKTGEFSELELPIEVRKSDLELVARPLSSETVSVEPGTYLISAELPSGQKITRFEEVSAGNNSITLAPEAADMSPHESHERTHFLRTDFNELKKMDLDLVDPTRKGKMRILRGNPLLTGVEKFSIPDPLFRPPFDDLNKLWKVTIPSVDEMLPFAKEDFLNAQFIQPGQRALNLALPRSRHYGCELVVTPSVDGNYRVSVQLENLEADLLLRYREENLYDQLEALSRSRKVDPEGLLQEKMDDPIGAAVGAYGILRFGEMERLHNWTENLKNWFNWLPDGAAIRGEHLARMGNNKEALTAFLLLKSRGLPFFSDGLNFAIDRLRLYKTNWSEYFGVNSPDLQGQAETLLSSLEKFEPFVDFGKAILTFTGLNPSEPDDRIIEDVVPDGNFDFEF